MMHRLIQGFLLGFQMLQLGWMGWSYNQDLDCGTWWDDCIRRGHCNQSCYDKVYLGHDCSGHMFGWVQHSTSCQTALRHWGHPQVSDTENLVLESGLECC